MISFTKAYQANGKTFATLAEAQAAELQSIFECSPDVAWTTEAIAGRILDAADKILDILTTTENSRPLARKTNGGKKPRKPKTDASPTELPVQ